MLVKGDEQGGKEVLSSSEDGVSGSMGLSLREASLESGRPSESTAVMSMSSEMN